MNVMENATIGDWFGRGKIRFEIPNYQRAYAWEAKHRSQFIVDLKESGDSYYLGHFLLEQREEDGNTILSVIDGQQRLTTCIIFFSAAKKVLELRREEWQDGEDAKGIERLQEEIDKYYLKNDYGEQRFKTVKYDNDFFRDAIIDYNESLPQEDTASKKHIREAREYFEGELKKCTVDTIRAWVKRLENATITTHIVEGKGQAAQIFAYQNDRGKPLTSLEVLKAYLLLQLFNLDSKEGDRSYSDDIEYIEGKFDTIYHRIALIKHEGEDDVLKYYWRSQKGYGSGGNVVNEVKGWLKGFAEKEQADKIKEFVRDLAIAFELVEKIEANNSFDEETAFYVKNLKRLTNDKLGASYPLLIRAQLVKVEDKAFARLVKLLENMMFRHYVIRRYRSADINSRFNAILHSTNDTRSLNDKIDGVKWALNNEGWWMYWKDGDMLGNIGRDDFYSHNQHVAKYLLWRYEHYLCDKNYPAPKVSWNDIVSNESLEHIAPQTPPGNLAESGYGVYYDEENPDAGIVSGGRMNCVGNLALMALKQNIRLKNKPFEEKLKVYNDDNLLHQQQKIKDFATTDNGKSVWDKAAIERRRDAIVAAAREIWDLEKI